MMRWVFVVVKDNLVEKTKVFDDYFEGELHTNEFLRLACGVEEDFPEYRKGVSYKSQDGLSVGYYKDNC
jgi:hypothetical protein